MHNSTLQILGRKRLKITIFFPSPRLIWRRRRRRRRRGTRRILRISAGRQPQAEAGNKRCYNVLLCLLYCKIDKIEQTVTGENSIKYLTARAYLCGACNVIGVREIGHGCTRVCKWQMTGKLEQWRQSRDSTSWQRARISNTNLSKITPAIIDTYLFKYAHARILLFLIPCCVICING